MTNQSETLSRQCQFLDESYFQQLFETFTEAFSDYVVPFALTETQFRNHINLNAVDLEQTIGCFEGDRLIGFSMNGFGKWNGRPTVYDAGTGVIPLYRRQGVSRTMFEIMSTRFRSEGVEQWLLEVITTNRSAISLYEKLGFRTVREVELLQCDSKLITKAEERADVEIRDIDAPDWNLLTSFWDGIPSWQNSVAAIERSRHIKRILGAFSNGVCVGYIVFSSKFGRVAQIAVEKHHRNRGIGTVLLQAMQTETAPGFSLQIINIDRSLTEATNFCANRGFYESLVQYEMTMQI